MLTRPAWTKQPLTDRASVVSLVQAVLSEAHQQGVELEFPPPPEPATCCGRGCNGCVWEGFFVALAHWRERAVFRLYGAGDP